MNDAIERILTDAAAIVDATDVPADCRAMAFSKAVDLLAENRKPSGESSSKPAGLTDRGSEVIPSWMNTLERVTNKTTVQLEEVFFADDDGVPLIGVDPDRLGDSIARCSRSAILLLVGVRQVGGIESATDSELLREECKRLGVFDQSNFGKTLSNMRDCFNFTGSGALRVVRLKPSGRKAFRQLCDDLISDSDR